MECPGIPEIGLDEWAKSFLAQFEGRRFPLMGTIELTHRCNVNCVQCYCNLPVNDRDALAKELTLEEVCDIIDQIAAEGCLWLLLTGGEPLLRPEFLDIYSYAKKKGMLVMLFTNGTLLDAQIADHLAEWPPRKVEITLHGITRETFENVSRAPGSYDRCMQGIELLLERDLPLNLKTTVTTLNKHELRDTREYVESLGVGHRFDALLVPRVDGSKQPYRFRLTPEELVALDTEDDERRRALERVGDELWGSPSTDSLYVCGAGKRSFHIDPYGRFAPCLTNRAHTYDLRRGSFREAWRDFIPTVRSLKAERAVKCRTCPAISLCGQCPAWSYMEHRDLETPVEYLCEMGHLRATAFREGWEREEKNNEATRVQETLQEAGGHPGETVDRAQSVAGMPQQSAEPDRRS